MLDAAHGEGLAPVGVGYRVHVTRVEVQKTGAIGKRPVGCEGGRAEGVAVRADVPQVSRYVAVARSRRFVAIAGLNAAERGTRQCTIQNAEFTIKNRSWIVSRFEESCGPQPLLASAREARATLRVANPDEARRNPTKHSPPKGLAKPLQVSNNTTEFLFQPPLLKRAISGLLNLLCRADANRGPHHSGQSEAAVCTKLKRPSEKRKCLRGKICVTSSPR